MHLDCEKFLFFFNLFKELVHELSTFEPTLASINPNSLKKYVEWLNFLWTEYAFLYNGIATSAYRLKLTSEGSHKLCYDKRNPIKNEMAKLQKAEKHADKKRRYKGLLAGNTVRFDEIKVAIDSCQRELKESANFIFSRVKEKERKSTKSSKFIFSRKIHQSNIPYTLEIYINGEKIEFDITCPDVTPRTASIQMFQHEWCPHHVINQTIKKKKGNSRQPSAIASVASSAEASVAASAEASVAASAEASVAASEEAPAASAAAAAKTPVSTKKRKLIVLSQESESKSESPKSPNLPLIEEAVVITTSATTSEQGISNAQAPAPRRKKVVVLSPTEKYSHSKLSSAVIEEAIVPASSPDKGLHAHELSRYQFHNERVHSLLAITYLGDLKESFIHVVRDSLQKKTRRKINSICVQIMELFKNYTASGDDTHLQSVAIASLWSAMTITDEEMTEMKTLLDQCIANVTAEEALFLDLSGEGCISLREQTFLAITESGGELESLFRNNQREASIKHLEDLIGVRLQKEFSFESELARVRSFRILQDFYESPLPRIGTLVTVPHQSLSSGSMECYDGVAAVPPLVAGESAPATNDENAINALINGTAVLALDPPERKRKTDDEPVPWDKETRLRKKKDGGGGGGGSGRRSGGGGGGKRRQSKKKKVEDKESELSDKEEEESDKELSLEESDKEEDADSDKEKLECSSDNSMHVSETLEDKLVAVSDSNFFDMDDEKSVNSGIVVRPFFPDLDPDSDDEYYKEDVVVEAESSVIAAPTFNDWTEMLEWIYDTLKEDFSLDEIIEALDSLDVFDAVTDLTEDNDMTSSVLSSNNNKQSSSPHVNEPPAPPPTIITPIVGITSQTSSALSSIITDELSSSPPIVSVAEPPPPLAIITPNKLLSSPLIVSVDEHPPALIAEKYWRPIDA